MEARGLPVLFMEARGSNHVQNVRTTPVTSAYHVQITTVTSSGHAESMVLQSGIQSHADANHRRASITRERTPSQHTPSHTHRALGGLLSRPRVCVWPRCPTGTSYRDIEPHPLLAQPPRGLGSWLDVKGRPPPAGAVPLLERAPPILPLPDIRPGRARSTPLEKAVGAFLNVVF